MHLLVDAQGSEAGVERVGDRERIRRFSSELTDCIGMRRFGEPLIEHFAAASPSAAGYSLVQLIETSSITGHFCDCNGDFYLDIFSCRRFDTDVALVTVAGHFLPWRMAYRVIERDARGSENAIGRQDWLLFPQQPR